MFVALSVLFVFCFKQKTAYEMRISDWSSDVCSSDLPSRRPAAEFFLDDVYGDRDFTRRDADIARVLPMMQRLLPEKLLGTVADAIELGALTQALDLRMAQALQALAPRRRKLDAALYAEAYREVGLPRLRSHQIALIRSVGRGFGKALKLPGVAALLAFSRGPAKLAGDRKSPRLNSSH